MEAQKEFFQRVDIELSNGKRGTFVGGAVVWPDDIEAGITASKITFSQPTEVPELTAKLEAE